MIPVLGVAALHEQAHLDRMLESVDRPVADLVFVDNSKGGLTLPDLPTVERVWHLRMPSNLGVATSWNLIVKSTPFAPWWMIVNADVWFEPGALERLAVPDRGIVTRPHPFSHCSAFVLTEATVADFGLFDEYFHPIYFEDTDYLTRLEHAGEPIHRTFHGVVDPDKGGSQALRHFRNKAAIRAKAAQNANGDYYREQHAGDPLPQRGWDLDRRRLHDIDGIRP